MEIHNTTEDIVIAEVNAICDSLQAKGEMAGICTCSQCRQDAICYVLNRAVPRYMVSHRGAARILEADPQNQADISTLVYEGIRRVSHNQRPYFEHGKDAGKEAALDEPVFNIPTIMGRVFSGLNFSPMSNINVELLTNGTMVEMKDPNWQNPYIIIPNTGGTFTFWPKPLPAKEADERQFFEYTVKINADGMAELNHGFTVPVMSGKINSGFSLNRTFKLPDFYLFPPGEEKDQRLLNE
ncbi:MAG: late competence development ComFB family protein [Spirochaetaceae bacterium]|jgi:competence protein ComFB|nr:late competence development ComFB family protein [Spirochaetaceae bacterium]